MILFAVTVMSSCNKSETIKNPIIEQESTQQFIAGVTVKDGTLHFESEVGFYELMYKVDSMSDVQFNELALKTGFKSYRAKLNIAQAKRTAKIDAWVDSMELVNPNFKIVGENPFFDELVIPKIKSSLYRSIVNEDGVFYIDGVKNLVDATHVSGFSISNTRAKSEILIGTRRYVNETTRLAQYPAADFRCNEKKVTVFPTKHYMTAYHPTGEVRKYSFAISSVGYRYRWGAWRIYDTRHNIIDLNIDGLTYPGTHSNVSTSVLFNYSIPDWYFYNESAFYAAKFSFRFYSQGTGAHGYGVYDSENVITDQYVDAC